MTRSLGVAGIIGIAFELLSTAAGAATFVVNTTLDSQDVVLGDGICADLVSACSLRAAISEANALASPDVITLPAGIFTNTTQAAANEDSNLGGDLDINSDITINGAGSATTIVQAATTPGVASERVFHLRFSGPKVLNDLTVRHGRNTGSALGAGVLVEAGTVVVTLNRVVIANNEGGANGGGLAISSANASITTLNLCSVENNTTGSMVSGPSNGAGVLFLGATATLNINDSNITGNTVSNMGSSSAAGLYSDGILNITNTVVSNNTATSSGSTTFAGGINIIGGTATILGSTIGGNVSTVTGGGGSGFAGGISSQDATLILANSVVSGNTASRFHAGIRTIALNAPTTTTITNSTISNNTAAFEGGGVINFSGGLEAATTNITGSTVRGNSANGPTNIGGGLENFHSSTGAAVINVTNSTVSGNIAARGAGSHNSGIAASINFNFSTIAGNTATVGGGGIFQTAGGTTSLKNSVVADNAAPAGPDISGVVTSLGYNLVENVTGGTFAVLAGDVTGTDPQLGPLANNGGSTMTHRPSPSSLAIDAIPTGTSDCGVAVTTSQNGLPRPQQAGCDKGSVEVNPELIFRDGFDGF